MAIENISETLPIDGGPVRAQNVSVATATPRTTTPLHGGVLRAQNVSVATVTPRLALEGHVIAQNVSRATATARLGLRGPVARAQNVSRATAAHTRMMVKIASVVVIQQPGLPAFTMIGREDVNNVSLIDNFTPNQTVNNIVYRTRPLNTTLPTHLRGAMGEQEPRAARKRVRSVLVFGEGTLAVGSTLTVNVDGRSETYSALSTVPAKMGAQGLLIYQEPNSGMTGRLIDVQLNLSGTGIIVRDIIISYQLVG